MKLSILTPLYNGEEFVDRYVDSIQSLEYKDIEIVISNDGSTDGSPDRLTNILKHNFDVKLVNSEVNQGCRLALFNAVKNATGEYIFIVSMDDKIDPRGLGRLINDLLNYPDKTLLAVSLALMKDGKFTGVIWDHKFFYNPLDYVIYSLERCRGVVSNAQTPINREDYLESYIAVDKLLHKVHAQDMKLGDDTLLTNYMILNHKFKYIAPVYHTFNWFNRSSENAVSKNVENRIKDTPVVLAYIFTELCKIIEYDKIYPIMIKGIQNTFSKDLWECIINNVHYYTQEFNKI